MSIPYMKLYIADYIADTSHLSVTEHGAYLLLIMHYWQRGGLPTDERQLRRIARMHPQQWARSRDTLAGLFDENWSHKRIERELKTYSALYQIRSRSGELGGHAKALKYKEAFLANAKASASVLPWQSESERESKDSLRNARASALRSDFEKFWEAWPNKVGKPAARKAFAKASQTAKLEAILEGVQRYIASKPADRPWLNPTTFLNQERWNDAPAPTNGGGNGNGSGTVTLISDNRVLVAEDSPELAAWSQYRGHKLPIYQTDKRDDRGQRIVGRYECSRYPPGHPKERQSE